MLMSILKSHFLEITIFYPLTHVDKFFMIILTPPETVARDKPMARNMLLTFGTALSRSCIFSSLRQDLVRRLSSTSQCLGPTARIEIINNFIQLAVNSGHRYQYVKSVVLQAISKYVHMIGRAALPVDH